MLLSETLLAKDAPVVVGSELATNKVVNTVEEVAKETKVSSLGGVRPCLIAPAALLIPLWYKPPMCAACPLSCH